MAEPCIRRPARALGWRVRMSIAFCIVFGTCFHTVGRSSAQIAAQCPADQYFDRGAGADPVITEFALGLRNDECPIGKAPTGNAYDLARGRPLYVWMRLQGNSESARSPRLPLRIDLRVFRIISGERLFQDAIGMGRIIRADAIREATWAGGKFDWRLGAEKFVFIKPGSYEAAIFQGNKSVCIADPAASDCVVRFSVR